MPKIPQGDVLIHAGYCMGSGSLPQADAFTKWMGAQPHGRKIIIPRKFPALAFCLFNETHKDGLVAHDQKALRSVPRQTTWQEIDTTNWPLGSQSEHSDLGTTLSACALMEWSRRRNVMGVAVHALVIRHLIKPSTVCVRSK